MNPEAAPAELDSVSLEKQLEFLKGAPVKTRDRNCKAVECVDTSGVVIAKFKSGAAARKVLNVGQEEISLCCRGLKSDVNGYIFRFADNDTNCIGEDGTIENPIYESEDGKVLGPLPGPEVIEDMRNNLAIKKRKSNAKAVECLDEYGNVVAKYRSGIEAAQALGVLHGEVSMACRGLKNNIRGFRFRFEGDEWNELAAQKRLKKKESKLLSQSGGAGGGINGTGILEEDERLLTRTSKYRGENFTADKTPMKQPSFTLPPAHIKVRSWNRIVPDGFRLNVPRWIPSVPIPTPELQENIMKKVLSTRKKKRLSKISSASAAAATSSSSSSAI